MINHIITWFSVANANIPITGLHYMSMGYNMHCCVTLYIIGLQRALLSYIICAWGTSCITGLHQKSQCNEKGYHYTKLHLAHSSHD